MTSGDPERPYLLVDGHSIIHCWPELRALHGTGDRRHTARELLLHRLRTLQDSTAYQIIVVFDGPSAQITEEREADGLQIFYAGKGKTADDIIERLVAKYAGCLQMTVSTADQAERMCIESFGAFWLPPEQLREEMERVEKRLQASMENLHRGSMAKHTPWPAPFGPG